VSGAAYTVTELSTSATVPSQTTAIDARTKQLPLLYINKYKMSGAQYAAAEAGVANNATHVLTFEAALPPVRPSLAHPGRPRKEWPGAI
jgi:hypothetical protein